MTTNSDQHPSPDNSYPTEVAPKTFKFVGPYNWVIYTADGTLTSDWAKDKDSDTDVETGGNPSGRAFAKNQAAGPSRDVTSNVAQPSSNPTAFSASPAHREAFENAREVFKGLRHNWEKLFNRFLETSLKYTARRTRMLGKKGMRSRRCCLTRRGACSAHWKKCVTFWRREL